MKKINKKGNVAVLIGIAIGVLIFIALITSALVPFLTEASVPVYECRDFGFPVFNESKNLCFNQTDEGAGISESPTNVGLSSSNVSLILLIPTFLIIGAIIVVVVAIKMSK